MQQDGQRNLTGEGREERRRVTKEFDETMDRMYGFDTLTAEDEQKIRLGFEAICGDISRERARIGGDWAVAWVVPRKEDRDLVR